MRSIQEVGTEILGGHPSKLYVFCGDEWGIKKKYLTAIADTYSGKVKECNSAKEVFSLFSKKQLLPPPPSLYIVRYDEEYLSALSDVSSTEIDKLKILGTVVLIYETQKQQAKVEKYLDKYGVIINKVAPEFVFRYLSKDFSDLSDTLIHIVQELSDSYGESSLMCGAIVKIPSFQRNTLSRKELELLFGKSASSSEAEIRKSFASRNVNLMIKNISEYSGDLASIYYVLLSCMVDLERHISSKYFQSDIKEYANRWTISDIYFMFANIYDELKRSRSSKSYSLVHSLQYLCFLSQLDPTPRPGELR